MGIDWYYERQHSGVLPEEIDFKMYLRHASLQEIVVLQECLYMFGEAPYDPPEKFNKQLSKMRKAVKSEYMKRFRAWQDEEHDFVPSEVLSDLCGRCGKDKDDKRHF